MSKQRPNLYYTELDLFILLSKIGLRRKLKPSERRVLVKVYYSEYATPVVPVLITNGKIRLCGDYKLTLNNNLIVDEHSLSTSEELFNGLAEGDKFTKIDLRNAYLNWKVRDEDQHLLTFNTHKGHYNSTRLMFDLNGPPAKWQRKIENILKGIPGVYYL
ncbi:unnamed protein product [Parnassius mnemosyne]|uniref:Reverse transcriptase domain-containing protein n=1 Tax=Parnassius mnemosyne TaxID=213953 RepID=A0AAV1KS57_9NEOP